MIRANGVHAPGLRRSLGEIGADVGRLASLQCQLLRRDARASARDAGLAGAALAGAGMLAMAALLFLGAAGAALLHNQAGWSWAAATALVAVLYVLSAAGALFVARAGADRACAHFDESLAELKTNVTFLRDLAVAPEEQVTPGD